MSDPTSNSGAHVIRLSSADDILILPRIDLLVRRMNYTLCVCILHHIVESIDTSGLNEEFQVGLIGVSYLGRYPALGVRFEERVEPARMEEIVVELTQRAEGTLRNSNIADLIQTCATDDVDFGKLADELTAPRSGDREMGT